MNQLIKKSHGDNLPRFDWYEFSHSFSPLLLDHLISQPYSNYHSKNFRILDPYCGSGTLPLRAAQMGISCTSIDILPSSYHITVAKTSNYEMERLEYYKSVIFSLTTKKYTTDVRIMHKLYSEDSIAYLLSLSKAIMNFDAPYNSFFFMVLFNVLDLVSAGKKSGATYRILSSTKSIEEVKETLNIATNKYVELASSGNNKSTGDVHLGDARTLDFIKDDSIDWIITSPPYPNRQDYTRIFAPELTLCFSEKRSDHSILRKKTLRSHLEAKYFLKDRFIFQDPVLSAWLEEIDKHYSDSRIKYMIQGYFSDMYISLSRWKKILKKGGLITVITSNAKYANTHIEVDLMIEKISQQLGYGVIENKVLRFRGNTPQQMKLYSRQPMRETMITLTKK